MKESEVKKATIFIKESNMPEVELPNADSHSSRLGRYKKPIIYLLMGIAFLGCMYLLFLRPSTEIRHFPGLNDSVPEASTGILQSDKAKAYEQQMMDDKEAADRKSLMALSDYFNKDSTDQERGDADSGGNPISSNTNRADNEPINNGMAAYRDIKGTVGSFYSETQHPETEVLRKEVEELKQQLSEREVDPGSNQLAMMEKSFQLASKYFPAAPAVLSDADTAKKKRVSKSERPVERLAVDDKSVISRLSRGRDDTISARTEERFMTAAGQRSQKTQHNSIRAYVEQTQVVAKDNPVSLRLLEDGRIKGILIPRGTRITAGAKIADNRLQLQVVSIEVDGNVIPVELNGYDLTGQLGLYVPYSPEGNALTEIVANMGTNAGTNLSLNSSMGQQAVSDISKSAIQGVSGYFSKRVLTPKVTIKAGDKLLLMSK